MNFDFLIRTSVRSILIQNGAMTCSDVVRAMQLNPKNHKGTVHAIMLKMEKEGILNSSKIIMSNGKERRNEWFVTKPHIRKRDRIIAAIIG
jgi:hypothetical protein